MTLRISRWARRCLLPGALLLITAPGAASAQGVHATLTPASQTVPPGAEFDLEIAVTEAGSPFNGFDVVVGYDPSALTFLPSSPVSLQQGCLMTGGCSAACGNTFHIFSAAGDSLKVNDALLCDQISLTGPGQIYKLRFRTSTTEQVTTLTLRRAAFFNAGLFVTPLTLTGCTVTIGTVVGVGPSPAASGFGIRAEPNPFRGALRLSVAADAAGEQDLRVIDLLGRTIRRLPSGRLEAGTRRVEWDGRNDSGARAPAGIYLVQLRLGDRVRQTRVTKLW